MEPMRQRGYRYILYVAMLHIRPLYWGTRDKSENQMRLAGAIADWLHNMAQFSALDFCDFEEARFWQEYRSLVERFPDADLHRFVEYFERESGQRLDSEFSGRHGL